MYWYTGIMNILLAKQRGLGGWGISKNASTSSWATHQLPILNTVNATAITHTVTY